MCTIGRYRYEHIFIDNASRDRTVPILKEIAAADHNVKIIANARNFGHIRSPMHAPLPGFGRCRHWHRRRPSGSAGADSRFATGMGEGYPDRHRG